MPNTAIVMHQMPGRVRLRIPVKRGDTPYFAWLSEACSRLDMIQTVKTNAATGSMVVEFNDTVEQLFETMRSVDLIIDQSRRSAPASTATKTPPAAGTHLLNLVTGRDINPMFMIGSALAVLGIVQATRGKIMAPSLTLFWYAMDAYRQSRKLS